MDQFARWKRHWRRDVIALLLLLAMTAGCHWSILFRNHRPVGGDKTSFTLGLMASYGAEIQSGNLPLWNPWWGFGFPSLAESQTGVFYPLHGLLYGTLEPVDAFHVSYVLHRLLTVLVCYGSLRGLRLRPLGAWVGTVVYAFGGFAIVHLDHQWAVEAMPWVPLLLALTARNLERRSLLAWSLIPLTLAILLTIGHFQIAFMTSVVATFYALLTRLQKRKMSHQPAGSLGTWFLGMALGYGIAAAQLWPTYELQSYLRAEGALSGHYLTTHALPPWMLLQSLLPYLYFRDPLWRAVVWTPVQSAPEETLQFAGIMPLALVLCSLSFCRGDRRVRVWGTILLLGLLLSTAPFLPGYSYLTNIPGFSYFRASARWTLVTHLAIGVLAGIGADRTRSSRKLLGTWVLITGVTLALALVLGTFWFLVDQSAREHRPLPHWLSVAIDTPFPAEPRPLSEQIVVAYGSHQRWDTYTWKSWMRLQRPDASMALADRIGETALLELLPTALILALGLLVLTILARLPQGPGTTATARCAIVLFVLIDFGFFRYVFPESSVPRATLETPGAAVEALRELPEGSRVLGPGGNLLMLFGKAPIRAYRTLDVPVPAEVSRTLTMVEQSYPELSWIANNDPARLLGIDAVLRAPVLTPANEAPPTFPPSVIVQPGDPLADWLDGETRFSDLLVKRGLRTQTAISLTNRQGSAAMVVPEHLFRAKGSPENLEGLYASIAPPLVGSAMTMDGNERLRWRVDTTGAAVLILGKMYAPGWTARLIHRDQVTLVPVLRIDSYWQGVRLPAKGEWQVELIYWPPGLTAGLTLSGLAIVVWLVICAWYWRESRSQ